MIGAEFCRLYGSSDGGISATLNNEAYVAASFETSFGQSLLMSDEVVGYKKSGGSQMKVGVRVQGSDVGFVTDNKFVDLQNCVSIVDRSEVVEPGEAVRK